MHCVCLVSTSSAHSPRRAYSSRYATASRWTPPSLSTRVTTDASGEGEVEGGVRGGEERLNHQHVFLRADTFGPSCVQSTAGFDPEDPVIAHMSEDCLFLNVFTPQTALPRYATARETQTLRGWKLVKAKVMSLFAGSGSGGGGSQEQAKLLPVLIFIHGGAFSQGGSRNPLYEGSNLATSLGSRSAAAAAAGGGGGGGGNSSSSGADGLVVVTLNCKLSRSAKKGSKKVDASTSLTNLCLYSPSIPSLPPINQPSTINHRLSVLYHCDCDYDCFYDYDYDGLVPNLFHLVSMNVVIEWLHRRGGASIRMLHRPARRPGIPRLREAQKVGP